MCLRPRIKIQTENFLGFFIVKPAEEGTYKHSFNVDALVETLSKDRYLDTPCIPELKLMLAAIKQRKKTSNIAKLYVLQCVYNVLLENQ